MHKEIVNLLNPTILYSKLCGVFPSPLLPDNSCSSISYTVFIVILMMAPLTFLGTLAHDLVYVYNDITSFFLAFHFFILFVQHCTVLVTPVLTRDSLVKFFKIIESAQEALFNLNIRQPRSPSMLSQICWLAFFTVPLLMSIVVSTFSPISYSTAAISVAHPIVFYGTLSKMRIMMQLVKEKFDLLNWHLDDLNNRWPLFLPRPPDVTCSEFICVEKWRKTKYVHYDENHRQITSLKIEAFNRAHIKLCYAFHTLNYVFSVDSLVMTLCVGTIVMGECFSAITNPYNLQWRYTPYFIVSAIHIATSFITVLTVATNIKEQAHKTALLVHDLLDERDYPPDVFDELEGFSQALLHRKISFSAGGFFELDLKLLPRMASLMAPITLFLIQNNNRLLAFRNKPSVIITYPWQEIRGKERMSMVRSRMLQKLYDQPRFGSGYLMSVCTVSVAQDVWNGGGTVVTKVSMSAVVFFIIDLSIRSTENEVGSIKFLELTIKKYTVIFSSPFNHSACLPQCELIVRLCSFALIDLRV
ncbi:hypothetical protein J6590_000846 [Homalodisca vitripennis]|nr:hypothetical protein J6590_000846 [Homalodisca vitripennis]